MDVTIIPNKLQGTVTPPSSKSVGHRALIAAALSGGFSTISNLGDSKDIQATRSCLSALKTGQPAGEDGLPLLDCGESGSTLRFLIPLSLVLRGGGHFTGRGRLMERPQGPYFSLFQEKGIFYQQKDGVLTVRGTLNPGRCSLPGDVSSQFITGLLFALPLLDGNSEIVLTTPLESRGYVDLTLDVLRTFGIRVLERADAFHVPGSQHYESRDFTVEADWSQAAFWYAANFAGGQLDIQGLNMDSKQGDKVIALQYWQLAKPGEAELDVSQCPDLVPPLAAMAAVRAGTTHLTHAARLRMKESEPALHCGCRPAGDGSPGGGRAGQPDHPRPGAAARGRNGGLLQRPPHRHDGRRVRRLRPRARETAGCGVRQKILSGILGPFYTVGRGSSWPRTSVSTSTCRCSASPTPRPSG